MTTGHVDRAKKRDGMIKLLKEAGAARFSFPAVPRGTVVRPHLEEWCVDCNGALAHFCWGEGRDDDPMYDVILTADALEAGEWEETGFVCKDKYGRTVCMELFKVERYAREAVNA